MTKKEKALSYFSDGYACSQSVLMTYCEEFGMDQETAARLTAGFGGGISHLDELCGAVSGAFMVIGLRYGSSFRETVYGKINEFTERFKSCHEAIDCSTLIGYDLSTEEGYQKALKEDRFSEICPEFIEDTIEILEEIL